VFAQIPPSALREELLAMVADRTNLAPTLVGSWLAQGTPGSGRRSRPDASAPPARGGGAPSGMPSPPRAVDALTEAAPGVLVACLAVPTAGTNAIAGLDLDATFGDELTRRAAAHLRDHISSPLEGLDPEEPLYTLIAKLSVRAAQSLGSADAIEGASINI